MSPLAAASVFATFWFFNSLGWEDAVPFMETDAILELISRKPKLQVGWLAQATHLHAKGQHELAMEALAKGDTAERPSLAVCVQ